MLRVCSRTHDEIVYYGHNCPGCALVESLTEIEAKLLILREQLDRRGIEAEV